MGRPRPRPATPWAESTTVLVSEGGPDRTPRSAPVRLFCLPYAGSGAATYRDWQTALEGHFEVRPVELPGRGSRVREPPVDDVGELVAGLADELEADMDGPHQVFGYGVGALVAFELVRLRRRRGLPLPDRLVVAASAAPSLPRSPRQLRTLPYRDLGERVERWGELPAPVDGDEHLLRLSLPALRSALQLAETYRYRREEPLDCPITAYAGARDPIVAPDEVAGWEAETSCRFSLRILPGDHLFLRESTTPLLASIASGP